MEFRVFVNENKNTVVVKLTDALQEYFNEFNQFYNRFDICPDYTVFREFSSKYEKQICKMTGVAKCNTDSGDTFDAAFGERLAKIRCLKTFEHLRGIMYSMMAIKTCEMYSTLLKRHHATLLREENRGNQILEMCNKSYGEENED